jgi:hypothetical protein
MPITTNTPDNFRAPDLEHSHLPHHWFWPPDPPIDQKENGLSKKALPQPPTEEKLK